MNESLIQVQAILDAEASKGNINKSLAKIQKNLNKLKVQTEIDPKALSKITKQLQSALNNPKINISNIGIEANSSIKKAEEIGTNIGQIILKSVENTLKFSAAFTQIGKEMYNAVFDIDTAMTNLYRVTDETEQKYTRFFDSARESAYELGRSISSLVEQTTNWAKLGFSLGEAEQLAKISSIYANVAGVNDATAVSDMVTAMKAFNIEASDAISLVDKLDKLGKEYATQTASLGNGLSQSASAMAASGTDLNKTLAMLTGGTKITQNASEFGNFLKIGSMRIRGMKDSLKELGEEVDETVDSISKVQTQILNRTGGKVNIFDDKGNLRDYYDIMKDISKVYNDLSTTNQAALSEILFGKQGGNQGSALMQAFQSGQIQEAYEATLNADGFAMQEQEQMMETLKAKTQQFRAAFQSLSSTVLDSGLSKWFVDFGTGAVQALDSIIGKLGSLKTIGLGAGLFAGIKNVGEDKMYSSICYLF